MHTRTPADVLRAAADQLDAHPEMWGRDFWRDPATGCRCSGGLIAYVIAPDDGDGDPFGLTDTAQRHLAEAAIELFEAHVLPELLDEFGGDGLGTEPLIGLWNDRIARDAAHVAETMRAAADGLAVAQ